MSLRHWEATREAIVKVLAEAEARDLVLQEEFDKLSRDLTTAAIDAYTKSPTRTGDLSRASSNR